MKLNLAILSIKETCAESKFEPNPILTLSREIMI
jgi:hypothetical protein